MDKEAKLLGDDPGRVFIGGSSQGTMVSIAAFLKYKGPKHLGGVIGLIGMQAFDYKKYVAFKNEAEEKMVDTMR